MIKEIKGDLLEEFEKGTVNVLVHCANCHCCMGSGIAAQIAEKYPEAVEADNETKKGNKDKLGTFSGHKYDNGKIIVNLYGQFNYGTDKRQLNYEAFCKGLERIKEVISASKKADQYIIGMPAKIGCDRAGGNWRIVKTMIEEVFSNCKFNVVIVEYNK